MKQLLIFKAALSGRFFATRSVKMTMTGHIMCTGKKEDVTNSVQPLIDEAVAIERSYKNGAYAERNQLVAALSKLFPAGHKATAIEGWDPAWHNCVYIDLPTGQVSWHIHESEMGQFAHLPPYAGGWDGHDTPEKYRRLAALAKGGTR